MMTTAALVALISALGWLVLNIRAYRSAVESVGWSAGKQVQMALIWVVIIAGLYLLVGLFSA